jgi:hypothetical protein
MVAIWQALPGGRAEARYQPVTWDETPSQPRAATAAQRAAAAPHESKRRGAS